MRPSYIINTHTKTPFSSYCLREPWLARCPVDIPSPLALGLSILLVLAHIKTCHVLFNTNSPCFRRTPGLQLPKPTVGSRGVRFFTRRLCVCLFFFCTISKKNRCRCDHQTWHRDVPRWVLETHLFLGLKVKGDGHKAQKQCRRGSLLPCESLNVCLSPSLYNLWLRVTCSNVELLQYNLSNHPPKNRGHLEEGIQLNNSSDNCWDWNQSVSWLGRLVW